MYTPICTCLRGDEIEDSNPPKNPPFYSFFHSNYIKDNFIFYSDNE